MAATVRELDEVVDDHLASVQRLAGEDTWTGPSARALQEDLQRLRHRLRRLADDWHALELRSTQS